jgi:hypothetical protein
MKEAELASSGKDCSKIITYLRILGIAFKFLNGLMTLRILSALKLIPYAMNSRILNKIIKKKELLTQQLQLLNLLCSSHSEDMNIYE